jgi:hypothetical protein
MQSTNQRRPSGVPPLQAVAYHEGAIELPAAMCPVLRIQWALLEWAREVRSHQSRSSAGTAFIQKKDPQLPFLGSLFDCKT